MDEGSMFDLPEVEESQDVEVTEEVTEETPVMADTPDLIAPPPVIEEEIPLNEAAGIFSQLKTALSSIMDLEDEGKVDKVAMEFSKVLLDREKKLRTELKRVDENAYAMTPKGQTWAAMKQKYPSLTKTTFEEMYADHMKAEVLSRGASKESKSPDMLDIEDTADFVAAKLGLDPKKFKETAVKEFKKGMK
jgi:hypothetical protein